MSLDFSVISQSPEIRALVQENLLARAFSDALFPKLLFRADAAAAEWPQNVGDSMIFTGVGLIPPKMRPLQPGTDPSPSDYRKEQWDAQLHLYADSIDSHMPTSINAIASLFLRNAQQLGMSAGQSLNRLVRNKMYNAAESGHTVADGAQGPTTSLRVARLNGFTRAKQSSGANSVLHAPVSASNPLSVTIDESGTPAVRNVIGFTADNAGDEYGPGVLTLSAAVTVLDRAYVYAADASYVVRVGGGRRSDDVGSNDLLRLADIRAAVARFWASNVPAHADGRYHVHIDPAAQSQVFADSEFQRLLTALPEHYTYRDFALGEMLGCAFMRNSECPIPETVGDGTGAFDLDDPFAPELYSNGSSSTGVKMHRTLFSGADGLLEYHQSDAGYMTEAGLTGKVSPMGSITNNGLQVSAERISLIYRAPLNRLQDLVSASWRFVGTHVCRTDSLTGDAARYKRFCVVISGE